MRFSFLNFLAIRARYYLSFLTVRPVRWFFRKMISASYLRAFPEKSEWQGWRMPNVHWWLLYKTVFKFFVWVNYKAWRPFCNWKGGYSRSFPLIARVIKWCGESTAGYAISGYRCYHCNSEDGCQVDISEMQDRSGYSPYVRNLKTWSVSTMDGTDHCFSCITVCPKCGYKRHYEDGSL